jgi:hypothetical protein
MKFELLLFSTDATFIKEAVASGVAGIIVDWEHAGKPERQSGADTEVNYGTVDDLRNVRNSTDATVICRINAYGEQTPHELEQAIGAGADEVLLPMVRTVGEVEKVRALANGRCGVGILVETTNALRIVEELARLPLTRVYVGLNDLAIERRSPNLFTALVDGTVEGVRRHFRSSFGFGGLTIPDRGSPIPCRLLIGEMARLKCSFSFLRRSFHRDIRGRDMKVEIPRILESLQQARLRSPQDVAQDRSELIDAISAWQSSTGNS